ncbi:MAG: hypothetical protein IKI04_02820, partial [Bacilli bacterium]|nr:hypothetical protein [Bacilli bacterium]
MDTKKRLLIIATILLIGLVIIGSTYAFWTWTSNTTKNVIFNTAEELKKYIVYDEGESKFSGNFEVSSSFNQGMHSTISLYKTGEAANVDLIATIHMNINSIGTNMANSTALKWVVTSGTSNNPGSIITQGNFINVSTGDVLTLVPNVNVTTTETFYNVWIWLDESENPSSSLTGETLDVNVWTEFNQNEGVEDRFEITQMTNSYQQINATIIDNKNTIVGYNITTTETEPSTWLDIPSNDQNNIYNFSYSAPDIGTYYIWFIDSGGNITHEVVEVTTIDSTPPVCTFGSWNKTIIGETETAKITLTCTDTDTGINNVNLNTTDITVSNSNLTVTNIVKSTTTNGYTYEITVTGANTNGNTTITLSPDAISNTAGLGNESLTSSAIMVDNEGPTITAQASTTVDMTNYIDVTMSDISGILGYNITTSSTAPTTWIPLNSYVEASTETKYEDSAAWARVFHHGVHGGAVLFSDDTEALSVNTTDKYSVLGNIENYRNGSNKFEFMLQYPDYSLTEYNRWRQTDNPTTTSIANGDGTEFVNGYEAVHIDWATSRWTGMALSSSTSTFMDGEVSHSNWHYAIGAHSAYRNGVPSIPNVTNYNASTQYVNLWARIDDKATTIPTGQIIRRIGDIRSNGTYYVWAKDKNGKTSYQTVTINKVDNTKPTVSLTGSGTSATITMSDNVGVVKYYFGATNPSTTNITWTTITSTTNTTINQTVSAAGTQYLIAMDAAGNVATTTLEYTQITGTFYYQSNATSGSETVSSTTASCIKASTDSGCSVTIPSAVKSSVGKYNNAYAGLSSSTGNMTQAVASGTTSVNLSTDTSYYAIYRSSVTNYYYGTSYTSRTLYRNQWFTSTTAMATTVLSTSTTGTSNYSTAVGPGSSVWSGLSTAADTTAEYANVAAAATSASGTLYTVYQFNITYAKSTNVSSIGATSGSCKVSATGASAGGTSCSVTLPTITANTGYTVQGWYTATGGGGTKAGNASASYTVSSTGATLYAYAKDTTAPTGSVTATLNGTTVNATVSASDTGSGLATTGTYGWKISSSSTCNSSVTGWTTNTNASYNFTGQSAGTLYVCVRVADKSGNYGYLSTQVKVKAYLKVVAYNTAYRTSTYSTKIKTVKFVQGVSNSGAVASWDLSENA